MSTTTVDVEKYINESRITPYQWLTVGLCFLVAMLDGIDTASMGFVAPSLMAEWHISRVAFGPVMSAALLGFAIGAIVVGPFADRLGRRKILLLSVVIFGFFNACCAFSQTPTQLMVLRLLTGIGLGTAIPTAATLLSEYVPKRLRAFLVTVMFAGFALGSGLAGGIAALLLGSYGWRGVLMTGGILPLLSFPLLLWLLPESARLLAVQGRATADIARLLKRVCNATFSANTTFISSEHRLTAAKIPVQLLFGDGYAFGTMLLWASCFMGLLILYLITGWLPTLISEAGYTVQEAASITALFQIGSIPGALIVGFLMVRIESNRVVAAAYFLGAIAIFSLGTSIMKSSWLPVQVAIAGFFIGGAQTGLNALAPAFYPTQARATGVSWMNGIGRGGAIAGALIGGFLLSIGWQFGAVFAALALPAMLAACAVFVTRYASRSIIRNAVS